MTVRNLWRKRRMTLLPALFCVTWLILGSGNVSPASFRVVKASLRVVPGEYAGPCPAEIRIKAKFSVTGKGVVVFKIVRSDNLPMPEFTMPFAQSGTRDTVFTWHQKESFLGWQQLKIIQPNTVKSNRVELSIQCQ